MKPKNIVVQEATFVMPPEGKESWMKEVEKKVPTILNEKNQQTCSLTDISHLTYQLFHD